MKEVSFDITEFFSRLKKALKKEKNIFVFPLGFSREHAVLCIRPKPMTSDKPNVLISGGFHGDEISGPWGIVEYLEENGYPSKVNATFLPLVNPTGFVLSRRANFWGDDPNNGYVKANAPGERSSIEDEMLKENISFLSLAGRDAYIALHEDDQDKFYIYSLGKENDLDTKIRSLGDGYFGLVTPRNLKYISLTLPLGKGLVKSDYDSSFEDLLSKNGVKKCITVEIPARKNFQERVELAKEVIKAVCNPRYY